MFSQGEKVFGKSERGYSRSTKKQAYKCDSQTLNIITGLPRHARTLLTTKNGTVGVIASAVLPHDLDHKNQHSSAINML